MPLLNQQFLGLLLAQKDYERLLVEHLADAHPHPSAHNIRIFIPTLQTVY